MKLRYTQWKDVKSFLCSFDEPLDEEFYIKISTRWDHEQKRWVFEVEIPVEAII